ncbi:hypothetical protein BDZ85DRAFT_313419 [Elsinoe ampelina]|uniref:Rhodopsin domain-containing protein n=1 Tax=Elsinoe ampelina TaxID=302913 RepID=A0A6A6GA84_9PEZI|nr:hypothetical protein BDZ85DRAFT_313419 [Elsinoe ampelina]
MLFGLLMRREENGSSSTYQASIPVDQILKSIDDVKIITIVLMILTIISVLLRFYVRLGISKIFGPEDWSMLVVFLLAMGQSSLSIVSIDISKRQWMGDADPHLTVVYTDLSKASGVLYILILTGLKISLGFFFLNIFSHKKTQRKIIYTIMALSTFFGLAYLPLGYGTCAQIKVLPGLTTTCPAAVQTAASAVFAAFSLVTILGDFALTIMAIRALYQAKLPLATKISACLLLVLGSAGGVASTVRMAVVLKKTDPVKYTQELFLLVKWVLVEIALGVIAANLAMVRPLFHKMLVKFGVITSTEVTRTGVTGTLKSGTRRTRGDPHGDELLLEEIKREVVVTVAVEEEKAPSDFEQEMVRGVSRGV